MKNEHFPEAVVKEVKPKRRKRKGISTNHKMNTVGVKALGAKRD